MSEAFDDDARVAKRIAKQHDIDDVTAKACSKKISELREQVEKLTKELDKVKQVEFPRRVQKVTDALKRKHEKEIAALAEQNEKMRMALDDGVWAKDGDVFAHNLRVQEALSLPNLASPVLNRIRAEGMRMAAEICATSEIPFDIELWASSTKQEMTAHTANALADIIRARADELEQSQ